MIRNRRRIADIRTTSRPRRASWASTLCGIAPAADLPELAFLPRVARSRLRRRDGVSRALRRAPRRRSRTRPVGAHASSSPATIYNTDRPYSTECADRGRAQIARYAWGDDYHDVIGAPARRAARLDARAVAAEPFEARAYVDTGPVQERVYAQHAGIGWIGKNTCVINPELGSWIFLGEIICSLPLDAGRAGARSMRHVHAVSRGVPDDRPSSRRRARLDALHLLPDDRAPRRHSRAALHGGVGSHVYGCDVCQEVCPWNAVAPKSDDPAWQPRSVWDGQRCDIAGRDERCGTRSGARRERDAARKGLRPASKLRCRPW